MSIRTTVTFNGTDLTALCHVSDLRTSLLPRTFGSENVPGRDGAIFTGSRLLTRTITLTLSLMGTDLAQRQQAARALAGILAVDEPKPLAISIDDGMYYLAIPESGDDIARYVNSERFDVTFTAYDPTLHGAQRTVTVSSSGSRTFNVGGTYPASPVISVPEALSRAGSWRITLDDADFLSVSFDRSATRALVFDCEARTLTMDGVATLLMPECDWFVLTPGRHTLQTVGDGTATVTWEERWL